MVKCMSRCAELSLRSGDELGGGAKGSTRDRKVGVSPGSTSSPGNGGRVKRSLSR